MSDFQAAVRAVVLRIPTGRAINYGRVAALAGYPGHARAVGQAMHLLAERDPTFPWWRVVNRLGRISTRCALHSMAEQEARLRAEGVEFGPDGAIDLDRWGWFGDQPRPEPQ